MLSLQEGASCPAKAGHPVRRDLSIQKLIPLEYWVTRLRARRRL